MKPWLIAALAATLLASAGLALWPADTPEELLPASRQAGRARPPPARATPGPAADLASTPAQLPTRPADWPAPGPVALAAWQGTPAPAAAPATAAPSGAAGMATAGPAGPAFPYRWIGQLDDGGAPQVLLASAHRSVGVRLGATLDGRWRLLRGPDGALLAQTLPDGATQAVPGAPPAGQP